MYSSNENVIPADWWTLCLNNCDVSFDINCLYNEIIIDNVNINVGIRKRNNALSFVGANDIHSAKQAHAKVLNNNGIIIDSPTGRGIKNTKRVIPKYAAGRVRNSRIIKYWKSDKIILRIDADERNRKRKI